MNKKNGVRWTRWFQKREIAEIAFGPEVRKLRL
jgi:hypothetical protein